MRKYTLASPDARGHIDLRDFSTVIENAVHEQMPEAMVEIFEGYYTVEPTPPKGAAIKIGRKISSTELGEHCIKISKLFYGYEITDERGKEDGKEKSMGGHF